MCVSWLIHMCDMPYSCVWHDLTHSYMCCRYSHMWTWLMYVCDVTNSHTCNMPDACVLHSYTCNMTNTNDMTSQQLYSHIYATWHIHTCDISPSHLQRDSFTAVTLVSRLRMCDMTYTHTKKKKCDMTYSYVWHQSFTSATKVVHSRDMTCESFTYVRRDSLTYMRHEIAKNHPHTYATRHIHMCDLRDSRGWYVMTHMCDMTHAHPWHDFVHGYHREYMTHACVCRDSFTYMWHDRFKFVT